MDKRLVPLLAIAMGCTGCCVGWPAAPTDDPPLAPGAIADQTSPWERSELVDGLTRRPVSTMEALGFHGRDRATLTVREHPRFGTDVYLTIERDSVRCFPGCRIDVVFDDGAPAGWAAAPDDSGDGTTVFLRRAEPFLRRLRAARAVRIEVTLARDGAATFLFPGLADEG